MTYEDKVKMLQDYCGQYAGCEYCPVFTVTDCHGDSQLYALTESELNERLLAAGLIEPPEEEPKPIEHDVVNHPSHYCHGGMECIDEMVLLFGKQAVMHFCLCNSWKYRKRAMFKNGQEDMDKADWYINKYKELSEQGGDRL